MDELPFSFCHHVYLCGRFGDLARSKLPSSFKRPRHWSGGPEGEA